VELPCGSQDPLQAVLATAGRSKGGGALNATGRVYILNSAGITFTGTSHVNVGALLATTAMTVDGDPTQSLDFSGVGAGQVINHGSIQVSEGGFAILAAPC
jgi:hypothetical protein